MDDFVIEWNGKVKNSMEWNEIFLSFLHLSNWGGEEQKLEALTRSEGFFTFSFSFTRFKNNFQ